MLTDHPALAGGRSWPAAGGGHRRNAEWISFASSIAVHAIVFGMLSLATLSAPLPRFDRLALRSLPLQVSIVMRPNNAPIEAIPAATPPQASPNESRQPASVPPPRPRVTPPTNPKAVSAPITRGPGVDIGVGIIRDPSALDAALRTRVAEFRGAPARLPRTQRPVTLAYPEAALRDGRHGRVTALVLLDAGGVPTEILLSPDEPAFGTAIRDALKATSFVPAYDDGKPVRYWYALRFDFAVATDSTPPRSPAAR